MSDWKPIETAPTGKKLDVWCKKWSYVDDKFLVRRFTDCMRLLHRNYSSERHPEWDGVPQEWCPTHWMPLPEPPKAK